MRYLSKKSLQRHGTELALVGVTMLITGGWLLYQRKSKRDTLKKMNARNNSKYANQDAAATDAPEVTRSLTIGVAADELYRKWLEPQTLTRVMQHFAEVSDAGDGFLHWQIHVSFGQKLTWKTRIVETRNNELIRWEAVAGAALPNRGSVRFRPAPGTWGTEVTLHIQFEPPGGRVGEAAANSLKAIPKNIVSKALRRFKSLVETGETPTLERNASTRGRGDTV